MAIRFDREFSREIARVVKNYNAKIARLTVKGVENLPQRILVSELKQEAVTRGELKRELRDLQRFSARAAEATTLRFGEVELSRIEYEVYRQRERKALFNLRLEEQQGLSLPVNQGAFKTDNLINIQQRIKRLRAPLKGITLKDFERRMKIVDIEYDADAKKEQFYNQLFDNMFAAAYLADIPKDLVADVMNELRQFSPQEISSLQGDSPVFKAFLDISSDIMNEPYNPDYVVDLIENMNNMRNLLRTIK